MIKELIALYLIGMLPNQKKQNKQIFIPIWAEPKHGAGREVWPNSSLASLSPHTWAGSRAQQYLCSLTVLQFSFLFSSKKLKKGTGNT
jgi:hypothetical protein